MANYTFTIQIQTNHFEEELTHEEYEVVAFSMLSRFDEIIRSQGLHSHTSYHASWMKGCVLENIVLSFQDIDSTTKALTAAGTYILLKDYSAISDSVSKLISHIKKISFYTGNIAVRVVRVVVNRGESPPLKHRIEPTIENFDVVDNDSDDGH